MKLRALVPLLTYPDPHTQAAAVNAATAAGLLGADMYALALEADIPPVSNAFSRMLMNLPEMIRNAEKLSADNGAKLLAAAKGEAETRSLTLTTSVERTQVALLGEAAARHARYFDTAIVGWNADNPSIRALAESVVFGSGRPTILLPDQAPPSSFGRVSIAWDGTRVAARAVSDARFILERATEITVVTVTDEKPIQEVDAGERLADGLRQAGLKVALCAARAEDCPNSRDAPAACRRTGIRPAYHGRLWSLTAQGFRPGRSNRGCIVGPQDARAALALNLCSQNEGCIA